MERATVPNAVVLSKEARQRIDESLANMRKQHEEFLAEMRELHAEKLAWLDWLDKRLHGERVRRPRRRKR